MLSAETLKKLQLEQQKLDQFIIQKKNLVDIKDREGFIRTKIALFVEIGELANELKTFKHWKSQKDINFDKAKEELADCFHFFLSWANSFEIDFSDYKFRKLVPDPDYNELLLALFSETESFGINPPLNNKFKESAIKSFKKSWQDSLNNLGEKVNKEEFTKTMEEQVEEQKKVYEKWSNVLNEIKGDKNREAFYRWLIIFEELARKMGMNEKDIEKEYMAKNKVNWERQQKNY
jgi:dimeric dUTPase (all-alpha-NTP-PPase superfamily)